MHNTEPAREAAAREAASEIVGSSPAAQRLREEIAAAARIDEPVLILGETGTGKELVARCIHRLSHRRHRPLHVVNCAGLRPEVLAAELFGHRAGAFTGAVRDRCGRMRAAEGSSILLDEISETAPEFQATVLRAVETGEIQPVGEDATYRVDVRVLATSNRPLPELASAGFRSDLLHRLAGLVIHVPPLRARLQDVAELTTHFLAQMKAKYGVARHLSPGAADRLERHAFPGNVRELRQVLVRAWVLTEGRCIGSSSIERALHALDAGTVPIPEQTGEAGLALAQVIRRHLRHAIALADDNLSQAARLLQIPRSTLQHYLAKYEIDRPSRRDERTRAAH